MTPCEYCHQPATHIHVTGCYQNHIRDYRVCQDHNRVILKNHNESPAQHIHCPQCGTVPGAIQSEPIPDDTPPQTADTTTRYTQRIITVKEALQQLTLMIEGKTTPHQNN